MGRRLMFSGHLPEAKQLFEDSRRLCNKHSMEEIAPALRRNFEELRLRIRAQKPPELSFAQMFDELHELAVWFPEAKKAFLPFWYYCRDAEIWGNTRSLHGVKFLVFEDSVTPFLQLADRLSAFGDLFLQVFSSPFPEPDHFVVPFPKDKIIPARVAIVRKLAQPDGSFVLDCAQGNMHSPYHFHRDEIKSESTGNIGITISARDKFGPDCAYELMMDRTSEELIRRRVMFFPYERHRAEDKCLDDLELSTDLGLLPVYANRIPQSNDVEVLRGGQVELSFPSIPQEVSAAPDASFAKVKRALSRLLSLKDQPAVDALTELAGNLDELRISTKVSEFIHMTAYLLRFPVHGTMQTQLAFVHHEK
jgi:hypothetical protein